MAADARWPRVRELFHACQALAPGERDAWLERECAGDTALLDEVRDLLGAQAISGDLLAADASELIGRLRAAPAQALEGQRIGAYRVLRLLGEGGMKGHYYDVEYGGGEFLVSLRDFLHRFETTADVLKGAGATLAVWCLLNDAASFTGLVVDAETMNFMGRRSIDFYISIYGSAPDHSD